MTSVLKPIIAALQAIDEGENFNVVNVCTQLETAAKHVRNLSPDYNIAKVRKDVKLSNAKLALRWDIVQPTYYDWVKRDKTRLYFLLLGAANNVNRVKYPLIEPNDFEAVFNDRGFDIVELLRVTGTSRNALKKWTRNQDSIVRAWDLIEGYTAHIS